MLKKFVLGTIAAVVLVACGGEGSNSASSAPAQSGAASGSLIERINNKGTITVGTEGTYAPFTYHDTDGESTRLRCRSNPRSRRQTGHQS